MIHSLGEGVRVLTNPILPEWEHVLYDDWEDRLEAMTAYHLCLDLMPIGHLERVVVEVPGALAMHPGTFAFLKKSILEKSYIPR